RRAASLPRPTPTEWAARTRSNHYSPCTLGLKTTEGAMPIFMDRHDMRDMTAEAVAAAHSKDLEVPDKYGGKYMTYWFDQDRGTGFCLVDAPDAATAERVHREAHGEIATDIIAVDLAAVEAFLGRITHPDPSSGAATRHAAA